MMVTDVGGKFIYLWAESSVQNSAFSADATKFPNGFYFDVVYSQTYVTNSGLGQFSERLMGGCGALAQTPQNSILMQGIVSNATPATTLLKPLGYFGDCTQNLGGNVSDSAGPYGFVTNSRTTLTVDVQFQFAPGTLGQGMGIPITDDYPDPNIPFTPDPAHIAELRSRGILADVPEPAGLTELPVPLCVLLGLVAWARRRR
jgi:hypothetical protein